MTASGIRGDAASSDRLGALAPIVLRKRGEVEAIRCGRGAIWAKAERMPEARGLSALRGGRVIAEIDEA